MGSSCSLGTGDATVASLPPLSDDFDLNSSSGTDENENNADDDRNETVGPRADGRGRQKRAPFQPPAYISLRAFHDDRFPEEDPAMRVYYRTQKTPQQQALDDSRRSQPQQGESGEYQRRLSVSGEQAKLQSHRSNSGNPLGGACANPLEQSNRTNAASAVLTTSATLTADTTTSDDGYLSRCAVAPRHRQQAVESPALASSFNREE
jgi:hypothetical protein